MVLVDTAVAQLAQKIKAAIAHLSSKPIDLASDGLLCGSIAAQERVLALAHGKTRILADEGAPSSKASKAPKAPKAPKAK